MLRPQVGTSKHEQPRRNAPTLWSVVRAAGKNSQDALATLCRLYWYPVYAFIRAQGHTSDKAHDLTQAFFVRFLENNELATLDPSRGRFRSWLRVCVTHFLANQRDHESAQKRGGGVETLSIDALLAEGQYQLEPSHDLTPERLYERRWRLILLEQVLATLRQTYAARGKEQLFLLLKGVLTNDDESSYEEIGRVLEMKEGTVRVAALRLRERFGEVFRAAVADTVENPDEVDDEIARLRSGL
jgi:RNA polymerase sigma factor (sigma-70 family)